MIESISAITLATHDMARSVAFYTALGFTLKYGGTAAGFTSFHAGAGFLNLTTAPAERQWSWWGRAIFHVDMWTRCTHGPWRRDYRRRSHRAMRHGVSDTSTSRTPMGTNSASLGHCNRPAVNHGIWRLPASRLALVRKVTRAGRRRLN